MASEVEVALHSRAQVRERQELARLLTRARGAEVLRLLAADKKAGARGELQMVLLEAVGRAPVVPVDTAVWRGLLPSWRAGRRP